MARPQKQADQQVADGGPGRKRANHRDGFLDAALPGQQLGQPAPRRPVPGPGPGAQLVLIPQVVHASTPTANADVPAEVRPLQ
ncbi:hypothetical protein GCM10009730_20780 [Streptomyces albidochromogenes]